MKRITIVTSGLLVATTGKAETNMGAIDYTTTVHDYKQFGPLLMPTRVVQQVLEVARATGPRGASCRVSAAL